MSNNTNTELIELLQTASGGLKKPEDLERLLEAAESNGKQKLLEDIAFTAKFLEGLLGIIRRGDEAADGSMAKYANEYLENIEKVKEGLRELINGYKFISGIFEEKYFAMTQEALGNLNDLLSDLAWYKKYLNSRKV